MAWLVQFAEVTHKRDDLIECAKLLEVPSPDFSSLDVANKDLTLHKMKWDLLAAFRKNREEWMTCPVRSRCGPQLSLALIRSGRDTPMTLNGSL